MTRRVFSGRPLGTGDPGLALTSRSKRRLGIYYFDGCERWLHDLPAAGEADWRTKPAATCAHSNQVFFTRVGAHWAPGGLYVTRLESHNTLSFSVECVANGCNHDSGICKKKNMWIHFNTSDGGSCSIEYQFLQKRILKNELLTIVVFWPTVDQCANSTTGIQTKFSKVLKFCPHSRFQWFRSSWYTDTQTVYFGERVQPPWRSQCTLKFTLK